MLLLRLLRNALWLLTWPLWGWVRGLRRRRVHTLRLRLHGPIAELAPAVPWWRRRWAELGGPRPTYLSELRRVLRAARRDPKLRRVLLEVDGLIAGWATCRSLRQELEGLRAASKEVWVFFPFGAGQRELYVASGADRVTVSPEAGVSLLGLAAQRYYMAPLLRRLGVGVEVFAQGPYKSAAEPLVRETMGEREREQLSALLASLDAELHGALCSRPGAEAEKVQGALARGLLSAVQAQGAGLVDAVGYEEQALDQGASPSRRPPPMDPAEYWARRPRPVLRPLRRRPKLALVRLEGAIAHVEAAPGRIAARPVTKLLRHLGREARVKGVLLYINSPGGSALASDLIHHELARLCAHKPVVAWFGDVAASGGYYIGCAARRIVAQPSTLTGSIGVIAARPVVRALLEQLGVRSETVKRGPRADLYSPARPLDEGERSLLEEETARVYGRFLDVVSEGRQRPREEVLPLAGGRVWSGDDAARHGLVDRLGGFDEAMQELCGLIGGALGPEDYDLAPVDPSRRPGPWPAPLAEPAAWLGELGPQLQRVSWLLQAVQRGERVFAYAPTLPEIG